LSKQNENGTLDSVFCSILPPEITGYHDTRKCGRRLLRHAVA